METEEKDFEEIVFGDKRLKTIIKLQKIGRPLSAADRKYKSRKIREIKEKLRNG